MKEINFGIESSIPLKMDRWVDGVQPKTDKEYMEQAKKKIYTNEKGELIIPANSIEAVIRYSANELVGPKKGKAIKQTIMSTLFVKEDLKLGIKKYDEIVKDIVTRTVGQRITRVPTYRPLIKKWKASGTIQLITDELSFEFIKQALINGGMKWGLLSHRPKFGRFIVTKFTNGKEV